MNVNLNNSNVIAGPGATLRPSVTVHAATNGAKAIEPELLTPGAESRRTKASRLAEIDNVSKTSGTRSPTSHIQGLNIIESAWNSFKKLGKTACLGAGWLSATAAVVSTFFFNIKSLGVLFGIPAALFWYTAASLGKDIKSDSVNSIVKDPLKSLRYILEKHPELLRNDPKLIVNTIQASAQVKKSDPRYFEVMNSLDALEDSIKIEIAQLRDREDELSLAYLEQFEDYLMELGKIERIPG